MLNVDYIGEIEHCNTNDCLSRVRFEVEKKQDENESADDEEGREEDLLIFVVAYACSETSELELHFLLLLSSSIPNDHCKDHGQQSERAGDDD